MERRRIECTQQTQALSEWSTGVKMSGSSNSGNASSPPEMVFDKAAGLAGDLWSPACVILEVRPGTKLVYLPDIIGTDDEEYIITVTGLLGELPCRWRKFWRNSSSDVKDAYGHAQGRLVERPGLSLDKPQQNYGEPEPVRDRILACRYKRDFRGVLKKSTDVGDIGVDLLADLLGRFLNWELDLRMVAQEALSHPWYGLDG
jgi:hypothetical protein